MCHSILESGVLFNLLHRTFKVLNAVSEGRYLVCYTGSM
jgi:hypothetical protein